MSRIRISPIFDFFYNYSPLFLGSLDFKNETISLNWSSLDIEHDFFLKSFPFYIFKTPVFNAKVQHFYKKLELFEITFALILDYTYHEKTLHFFNSTFFTIALLTVSFLREMLTILYRLFLPGKHIQTYFIKMLVFLEKTRYILNTLLTKKI